MDARIDLLGLTRRGFEEAAGLGAGRSRALGALYAAALREGRFEPSGAGIAVDAVRRLEEGFRLSLPEVAESAGEEGEFGVTRKAVFRLRDGALVESVLIPVAGGARAGTLCLSTQAGCRMGCAFCETGRHGFGRQLAAAEIVGQLVAARVHLGWKADNLVYMGMGEPLDNFEALAASLAVFLDSSGAGFAQERITVCTVGLPEGIGRLRGLGYRRLNLSVSLNAAEDATRSALMPVNGRVGLEALAAALRAYPARANFVLGVNYCLIPGLNDGPGVEAGIAAFAAAAAGPGRALLNLIPYNPGRVPLARAPTEEELLAFEARLAAVGLRVTRRSPRGRGLMAACGQLGGGLS